MVSLFHNKGLMYIQNAYLLKLFLHILALNTSALQLLLRFGFSFAQHSSDKAFVFKYSFTGVHNLSSPFSTGLKKRLVSFPSPALKRTITHSHTPPLHRMTLYIFEPQPAHSFKSPNPGGCQSTSKRLGCGGLS